MVYFPVPRLDQLSV